MIGTPFTDSIIEALLEASGFSAEDAASITCVFYDRYVNFYEVSGNPVSDKQVRELLLIAVVDFIADESVSERRKLDKFAIDFEKRFLVA